MIVGNENEGAVTENSSGECILNSDNGCVGNAFPALHRTDGFFVRQAISCDYVLAYDSLFLDSFINLQVGARRSNCHLYSIVLCIPNSGT